MKTLRIALPVFLLILLMLPEGADAQRRRKKETPKPLIEKELYSSLDYRLIGPFRGGRSAAVTGIEGNGKVFYMGSTGGGVWKTDNAGDTWKNISDGFFGGTIGAVAVAESDNNIVFAAGGEKTVRGNVSHGYGIWKSVNGGESWEYKGLKEGQYIPRLKIHPTNPDIVYAAVLGHLFGPNPERGIYRSMDGGDTWEQVLFVNENAGAVDLILDPTNPRIIYASTWRVRRTPYSLESGGEGSDLWISRDSGDTWEKISDSQGFPDGDLGIIGVSLSKDDPMKIYAMVEARNGGLFVSNNRGESWALVNSDRSLRQRAWYYTRLYADPNDSETIYVL
ncbi:MAG: glycosyl hydrolase, partial [Eudoraea sp.]|nr:glycosyl hydrolase [Eudoraea sp.]